ncbi:MAG: hypothetical protein GOMPHAMPRED_007294 [Gomphillus americanus]|uniref:BAG domain-containing protein n=1 Tax=Gomphillus americanus TaxID=1940652 RepID=A0A8H3IEU3_9LECA|nr:MAG: hypothetical protein GOMPHAMPRED_007294 [Gomphillus americanus]
MSRRSWYDRHASPYSSSPSRAPPVINDEDYVYMTQDDIVDPAAGFWSSSRPSATYPSSSTETPDILYVRHRNQRAKLEFPAFTIAEGLLKIGVIRKYAADRFRIDDLRRVKLIYRNQTLRDDDMPACNAELKQNSEITCIITAEGHDDSESSGEDSRRRRGVPRADVDGSLIYDDYEDYYPSNKSKGPRREPYANTSVQPEPSRTERTAPYTTGQLASSTPTQRASPSLPTPYTPPPGPRTPREKLKDLMAIFDHNHRPFCEAFLANPPADPKVRTTEHTKLSETLLTQVLLKLDDVETDGNEELRRVRKTAVQEVQAMLNQLDKVGGKAK